MLISARTVLLLSIVLAAGCHKKQPVATTAPAPPPVLPPPPVVVPPSPAAVAFDSADRAFAVGDYTSAAREFTRYLELVPTGGERDDALFQLGVIYALPGQQDWPRSAGFLNQLISETPQSPFRAPAQLILSIHDQATQLSDEVSRLTNEASRLRLEAAELKAASTQSTARADRLMAEVDLLKQQADQREQIIRRLNTDLERLIKIDSQRSTRP
jgi:TolA-binding protein